MHKVWVNRVQGKDIPGKKQHKPSQGGRRTQKCVI